jgi:signal transduction histidine kinase
LKLATHIDPEVPLPLRGDADRLRQMIINLVGNAIKFTAKGAVSLHIEPKPVDLEVLLAMLEKWT